MPTRTRKSRSKCPAKPEPGAFVEAVRAYLPEASPVVREWLETLLAGETTTWIGGVEVRAPAPEGLPPGVEPQCAEGRPAHCGSTPGGLEKPDRGA